MNHYLIMDPEDNDFIIAIDSTNNSSTIGLYEWFTDLKDAFNTYTEEYMPLQEFLAPNNRTHAFKLLLTFTDTQDLYTYFINHPELLV